MGATLKTLLFIAVTWPLMASSQMYLKLSQGPPPGCYKRMREVIFPKADMANAVCRPALYRSKSRRVKFALKRINRWKRLAKDKWDEEHSDDYREPNSGRMKPVLNPTYTYDQAVVYMYEEWAHECGRFNGKFADSLIELSHQNESCEQTVAFESFRRMWRDNREVKRFYENHGTNPVPVERNVASEEDHLKNR